MLHPANHQYRQRCKNDDTKKDDSLTPSRHPFFLHPPPHYNQQNHRYDTIDQKRDNTCTENSLNSPASNKVYNTDDEAEANSYGFIPQFP